jgi:hypothetical protein
VCFVQCLEHWSVVYRYVYTGAARYCPTGISGWLLGVKFWCCEDPIEPAAPPKKASHSASARRLVHNLPSDRVRVPRQSGLRTGRCLELWTGGGCQVVGASGCEWVGVGVLWFAAGEA